MQNLMIIDNNLAYISKIINKISSSISNLKIYNISQNINEAIQNIVDKNIDIIIININLSDIDILKYIKENNIEIYRKSIIIIYKKTNSVIDINKSLYQQYVYNYIEYSENLDNLIDILRQIVLKKENTNNEIILKNKIKRELKKLNFNFNHIGTKYIIDCIIIIYNKNLYNINLTKQVYPDLSKKYNKTINTIRVDMEQSIKNMYFDCEESTLMDYFGYLDMAKPSLKEVITTINEKI